MSQRLQQAISFCAILSFAGCGQRPSAPAAPVPSATVLKASSVGAQPNTQPDDHGDTLQQASPLRVDDVSLGCLERTLDRDWFQISLSAQQSYSFQLHCFGPSSVTLIAPDGLTELASAVRGELLQHQSSQVGVHYLRVGTQTGQSLHYSLEAHAIP